MACKLLGLKCIYNWAKINNVDSWRVKRWCQLVVKLKANKCYQELLYSLFSYINLLNISFFAQVSGLCVSATDDITTPKFVLNILLTILFWLLWTHYSGRIVDCIALIALLWPYCWLYCFNYIALIIFVFKSVFCFWYYSHDLLFEIRAV